MPDTVNGGATNNSNTFGASGWAAGIFGLGNTALQGYFATQTAKTITKAPAANAGILVGGIVALGVIVLLILRK